MEECSRCNGEIFTSGAISRCLQCMRPTDREVDGKTHFKRKTEGKCVICGNEKPCDSCV